MLSYRRRKGGYLTYIARKAAEQTRPPWTFPCVEPPMSRHERRCGRPSGGGHHDAVRARRRPSLGRISLVGNGVRAAGGGFFLVGTIGQGTCRRRRPDQ